jgi:hypothetical protein
MLNRLFILLIGIAFVGCGNDCEEELSKLDYGNILDTLNTEFSIHTGSNQYNSTFNDFSKLKFNSIDGDNGLLFESIEEDDIDSLRVIVDKDSIFLEYSHVQYGCTDFIPYLNYSGDTLTIKCRQVYNGEVRCYGGKIESNSYTTLCINVILWKVHFNTDLIKNGLVFFQPQPKVIYELPLDIDTSYTYIPVKGSIGVKSEIGIGEYVNYYAKQSMSKNSLMIIGKSLNDSEDGIKTNIVVSSEAPNNKTISVQVDSTGRFLIKLETGIKYQLICSLAGFESKRIEIDTRNSGNYEGGYEMPVEITLNKRKGVIKESGSVGLIFYNKESDLYESKLYN